MGRKGKAIMSLSMECYGLQHMIDDEEQIRALLFLTAQTGKKIPAYSGLYCNKYYKSLQIVVGEIINHETKSLEIQSGHTHNAGNSFWKCRVIQEINPEEYGDLDMRLLVEPISGHRSMTVIDVINADILPSYAPGEIIDLQVIAKARSATFYPDEAAFDEAEGQKTSIPMSKDGKREERYLSLAAGFPMPSGYMHNHTVKNEDDRQGIPNTDDDKWVYLRGILVDKLGYYPCQLPGKEDKPVNHPLPAGKIDTYFGKIHIMYNLYGLSREQQELVQKGNTVSVVCNIQGDALIDEYEEGIVINKKNNLMAVRYALSSGRVKRLLPVLADDCTLYSEARDMTVSGKEAVVDYLDERSRGIADQRKMYTIYGIIKNSEKETADYNLKYKAGERCIVIGKGEISEGDYSQIVFLDFDEGEKIRRIYLSSDSNYRFDKYASWEEMDRNSPENRGKSQAYWRPEKVFVDYLNRYGNHKSVENALCSILDKNTVMEYGSAHYEGAEKVLEFLEGTSNAISSDEGFIARPVIINERDKRIKAVALCSKLEDYVSWYFFLFMNDETGKVRRISGKRGQGYTHIIDHYEERGFAYEDPVPDEDVFGDNSERDPALTPEENKFKIAKMIAEAYTSGDFEPLFPLMTDDYEHHSFWVMEPMVGKKTVIPYYRGKGSAIRKSSSKLRIKMVRIAEPQPKEFPGELYLNGEKMKPGTRLTVWSDIGSICVLMMQTLDDGTESTVLAVPTINEDGRLTKLLITMPDLFTLEEINE